MSSCHEEGVRDRNRAGIEAVVARDRQLRFQLNSGREHPPRDITRCGYADYEDMRMFMRIFVYAKTSHIVILARELHL
eukprot:gene26269-biopygen15406